MKAEINSNTHTHTHTHTHSFCMNVAPPKIHVVNLMSSVMILEGGALGRYLGHEGGALKNGD